MKYKYEYYKKDKVTGEVVQYDENFTEEKSFKSVFDFVLAKHFFRDELAEGKYYYQVLVNDNENTLYTKTYINREEIDHWIGGSI